MSDSFSLPAPFPPQNLAERTALLDWIRGTSLVYGPWKGFKRLYKDVETAFANGQRDTEVLAALIARLDLVPLPEEERGVTAPPVLAGHWYALHVEGDLLYAVESNDNLVVFDLTAPFEPREIYRWAPPEKGSGYGSQLWIEGQRLIYGVSTAIRIFDLQNPREPRFAALCRIGNANRIDIAGDFIYAADYQNLRVLQLPGPGQTAVTEVGRLALEQPFYLYGLIAKASLVVASHYGGRNYRISFFDVSNPASPIVKGAINGANPNDWEFAGNVLVRLNNDSLVFTDVANPQTPREISKIRLEGAGSFHVAGDRIYVSCQSWRSGVGYETKLRIVDISQLHSPRLIGEFDSRVGQMAAYENLLYFLSGGLRILDVTDPARPQPVGQRPKNATFAYLKRRTRRLLRTLAEADGDVFVELAGAVLKEAGAGQDALHLESQWVSAELTLGGGARWHQASHGRGGYVRDKAKRVIKAREERAPGAWDAHLGPARELWEHPHLPWQTQEMALKILRSRGETVLPTSKEQLTRFLWSDSPALLVWAARQAQKQLVVGERFEPRALASLLWIENVGRRRAVLDFVEQNPALKTETATHLASLLGLNAQSGLARRAREIALLMAARFDLSDPLFKADGAFAALPALLSSAEAPVRALGLGFCRRLGAPRALEALPFLLQLPAANRESFVQALCEGASRGALGVEAIDKIVRHDEAEMRSAAWRLIEASQTSNETLRAVWTKLFVGLRRESRWSEGNYRGRYLGEFWTESVALQTAINSESALLALGRSELSASDVLPRFGPNQYSGAAANRISAAMWGAYSLILDAATVVDTIVVLSDWTEWRDAWVKANAGQPKKLAAFWNAVQAYLNSQNPETLKQHLRERTFAQSTVAATFGGAASQLSPELLMSLIGAVPENLWLQWRTSLLQTLQTDALTREAFWNAARNSSALDGGFLRARLLEDADFAATFGLLETDALGADNPAFTPLILAWLQAREDALSREDWLEAAIHPLPAVRDFGLQHLEIIGLDIPGALRLLESKLPPSIAFGQRWFENRGQGELELALVLSDSPQPSVRAFGREFIAARLESLLQNGLISYLQDNPNAEMQAFVAGQLKDKPEAAAPEFDKAVLRGRYRARKAKNLVQERRTTSAPLPDDKTLLELARGRTPRDSEWALSQLARRGLEGVVVEGVEMGEVAGI